MKIINAFLSAAVVLVVAGCGADRLTSLDGTGGPSAAPAEPEKKVPTVASDATIPPRQIPSDVSLEWAQPPNTDEPRALGATLRIKGEPQEIFTSLLARVRDVEVRVDGVQVVPASKNAEWMNLANSEHAWMAAQFSVPEGASEVEFTIYLADFGAFEAGSRAAHFDARGVPIRFSAPVSEIQKRGHAVVHLDLERSLVEYQGQALLRPALRVHH